MKAIIAQKPFDIQVVDVPKPQITHPDDVLVRVVCGGICGSDVGIYDGTNSLATYPRIMGHEFGGEVMEVGAAVTRVRPGDYVAVDPVRSCGHCYACDSGRHNVCGTLEVTGVHRDGGFAEFVLAPEYSVHKVDTTKIPMDIIGLIEPYSIGVQVNTRGRIAEGDKVLVMGSGPIGLVVMQVAKTRGAQVMMTDVVDSRLARARDMGADHVVNVTKESLADAVKDFGVEGGMPVVVDSVCSVDSAPLALELASPAGRVVLLGLKDKPSAIPQVWITKKELDVIGSRLNRHCFAEVIELFEKGLVTPEKLRSNTVGMEEVVQAIRMIKEEPEKVCKITIRFS